MTEVLDGRMFGPDQPCFGCAPDHPIGFRLSFEREEEGVVTRFVPDDRYQGPPGVMHGGLVMALADEIAAWTVIAATGTFGFTSSVEGKLERPVRVNAEVVGRGRVIRDSRRVVVVSVTIGQEERCFAGELRFVLLDETGAERLLGRPLPEAWRRFGRR